jgi:hypothetical protein
MLRRVFAVFFIAIIARSSLRAQRASQTAGPFAPLEFLVGHCWRGSFPGGAQTDEHCFEWVFNQKFVRDRHVVRGGQPYGGETIYFWDPATKRIGFSYWNTEGQMMPGYVVSTVGDTLTFSTMLSTSTGPTELRSTWTRSNADGYRVRQLQRNGGAWQEIVTMDMARVK